VSERPWYVAGLGLGAAIRLWRLTLRRRATNRQVLDDPCVLAVWHGRLMGVLMDQQGSGLITMASRSADGALAAGAVAALGMRTARGSSSRGGREAFDEMRRAMKDRLGRAALTVDGPKGPWREVQPGAVLLARRLRIPIVPASFSCVRGRVLNSWDHMLLPRPGTRVLVGYADPWPTERLTGPVDEVRGELGRAIDELTRALDIEAAGKALWPLP
jgi:lysophospholipid acyltransferase (LPLAT)-like uncharacterized protein